MLFGIVLAPYHGDKIPEIINLKGGKVSFWLMLLDISVHGHLVLLEAAAHLMSTRKQEEKKKREREIERERGRTERLRSQYPFQRHALKGPENFQLCPTL
jgi:hypothetical protein